MAAPTVIYDACVLYPAPLRDLLMELAQTDLFQARWTDDIHREWIESLLADDPSRDRTRLERTRDMMNGAVRDCLITGYEALIPALSLPDPDDRHVLAAAITGRADLIVTSNLKDFPAASLAPFGVEARHPDDFVAGLLQLDPFPVCAAVKRQRQRLKKPAKTAEELLATLEKLAMPRTVAHLRKAIDLI